MPELPEVETIVRELGPSAVGRSIVAARVHKDDVLRGITARTLVRRVRGATIAGLVRRAKHAVFELGSWRLVVQPGMSGSLLVHESPLTSAQAQYAVLSLELDDHRVLVYRDVRRLGRIYLLSPAGWKRYDARLGPEPLGGRFTPEYLAARLHRSRQSVKKLIMDQRVVVGVGNIYANEALFAAGIDPSRAGNQVTEASAALLVNEIRRILRAAIRAKGTTFRDYRTGKGERGNFQSDLQVYGRGGEPCVVCGTRLTETHLIDARTTVLCHRCQV